MKQVMTFAKAEQSYETAYLIKDTFSLEDGGETPDMFKDLELEKGRYFWGYANLATPDKQGDKFTLDALTVISRTLTFAPYNKIMLFHDYGDISSGTIVATQMDSYGLLVLAKLNEVHRRAEEVWGSILNKNLDGFSMSGDFTKVVSEFDETTGEYINVVLEATANEVTLTSLPVHPGASVMGAFRKSMDKSNKRFFKAFQKGKELPKTDKYKKAKGMDNDMVDGDDANDDANKGDDSQDNSQDDVNDDSQDTGADDANKGDDSDKKDDSSDDKKDDDDVDAAADAAAKAVSNGDDANDDSDKKDDKDDSSKDDKKKLTVDERIAAADKRISELEVKNKELEDEKSELEKKLGNYEKAVKTGFKKAMNQLDKKGIPYRKSKKAPVDKKDDSSGDSNSTPMLSWLRE